MRLFHWPGGAESLRQGGEDIMQNAHVLFSAMAEKCRTVMQHADSETTSVRRELPGPLRVTHLHWMCDEVERHAEAWPRTKIMRWIGFIQAGLLANGMLDLPGIKAMFRDAKNAHGGNDDEDLVDHLDANVAFAVDVGGEG